MSLDFSKPYAEVHGLLGAAFEQGGLYFKNDGSSVFHFQEYIEEEIIEDNSILPPIACYEQATPPSIQSHDDSIEGMPSKHLKALVESFGGEWTSKKAALEFMKGR